MYGKFKEFLSNELAGITAAGLYKRTYHHYTSARRH